MCCEQDHLSHLIGLKMGIETGAKKVAMETSGCHSGAKFKEHCLIFLVVFLIQYFTVQVELFKTSSLSSFASYKNVNISQTKKRYSNMENTVYFHLDTM